MTTCRNSGLFTQDVGYQVAVALPIVSRRVSAVSEPPQKLRDERGDMDELRGEVRSGTDHVGDPQHAAAEQRLSHALHIAVSSAASMSALCASAGVCSIIPSVEMSCDVLTSGRFRSVPMDAARKATEWTLSRQT